MKKTILMILATLCCYAQKPTVTITLAPYHYAIEKIAQDKLVIVTLIPEDVNPHIYEMKPQDMDKIKQSKLWFCSGESVEKKIQSIQTVKKVDLNQEIEFVSSCCEHKHHHHSKDLHTWISPRNYLKQSQLILKELSDAFPEHKDFFQANFLQLNQELTSLIAETESKKDKALNESFFVSHAAYAYLAKDLGLTQISLEYDGKEAHLKHIQQIYNTHAKSAPKKIFAEVQHGDLGARRLAQLFNAEVVMVNPYQKNYPHAINEILENLP